MLKKYSMLGLLALCCNTYAKEQNYSIQVTSDNKVTTSKNLKVNHVEILEGLEAAEYYREQLVSSIDSLAKSDTMRNIYESEVLLEDLVYVDSMIEKYHNNNSRTTVYGSGNHCNNNTFLDYSFRNSFFRYTLDARASTGTVGPFPPGTPSQYVTATATVNNSILRTDTDSASGQSLFVSASASVQSGLHSSNEQLPFVAQGTYFISLNGCFASKIIKVQGTKSYTTLPTITSIQN